SFYISELSLPVYMQYVPARLFIQTIMQYGCSRWKWNQENPFSNNPKTKRLLRRKINNLILFICFIINSNKSWFSIFAHYDKRTKQETIECVTINRDPRRKNEKSGAPRRSKRESS